MIGRETIRNAAMLKPGDRGYCASMASTGHHAMADASTLPFDQCVDCGRKKFKNQSRIFNPYGLWQG